jgi:hypothetical protein
VQKVRPGLHQFLEALDAQPALILGRRSDVLATNRMARALLTDFDRMPPRERNYARWMFLSDEARDLFLDWDVQARAVVENLRLDVGNDPEDTAATELVAELAERGPDFRRWWEEHGVYQRTFGSKHLRHPVVGELTVDYETFTLPGDANQTLLFTRPRRARPRGRPWTSWRAGLCPMDRTTGIPAGAPKAKGEPVRAPAASRDSLSTK